MNGISRIIRPGASIVLVFVAALSCAAPASAQEANRWRPWTGCWSAAPPRFVDLNAEPQQVCVVPAGAGVDIVTITGSTIVSRDTIDPDGEHHPGERDGCSGWQSARWSADRHRLYLQSEYTCPGGGKRSTSGLMATAANGDWLDVVGISLDDGGGVRVLRHRPSPPLPTLPPGIAAAVARDPREPVEPQAPIGDAEIVEASKHVKGAVIEAWLAENRQAFTINAARLKALAAAGVDDRVLDLLVALSYPQAFSIRPSAATMGALAIDTGGGAPPLLFGEPGLIGGSLLDCNPYFYGPPLYGCPSFYSAYAFGLWDYTGGWWAGGGGGIIIEPTPPPPPQSHGQVVNGKGYVSGDSSTHGSSTSGGSSASSGASSGGSTSSGASAGSSGGGRTAVPR